MTAGGARRPSTVAGRRSGDVPGAAPVAVDLDATVVRGGFRLAVALTVPPGACVAVVGPNGAGKSTLVHLLCGLIAASSGHVHLGDREVDGPGRWVPPEGRGVGWVPQGAGLLDHLDARDNVALALRCRGWGRRRARRLADDELEMVGLTAQARARPGSLSGGERQRVALARALVARPGLIVADEPLSAVDAASRAVLRHRLAGLGATRILVTHDPLDALGLAETVVVLEGGRISQTGTPWEVATAPRSPWAARFVGLNVLGGTRVDHHHLRTDSGTLVHVATPVPEGDVAVVFRPTAVTLHPTPPAGSARNTWELEVTGLIPVGEDRIRVALSGPLSIAAEITASARTALDLTPGARVWASVKATDIDVLER